MQDNQITLSGYVGTPVEFRDQNGPPWATFRVGSTPRYYNRQFNEWRDLATTWVTVKSTRDLAQNVAESLEVGDPVVITGRLRTQVWESQQGEARRREVLQASSICHDLNKGTTRFHRVDRSAPSKTQAEPEHADGLETLNQQSNPAA